MMPHDMERIHQERMREWAKEMRYQQLAAQLPQEPSRWRRWTGNMMVWFGSRLLRWGEHVAQPECRQEVSLA